jgi:hypothetical protein
MTTKEYYDKYLKKIDEGTCKTPECNNSCNFYSLTKGYNKHCSRDCIREYLNKNGIMKKRKIEKNGFYNNNRKKSKQTCLSKYGVENISQLKEVQLKKENTCLKNNEYKHYTGSKEHKNWMRNGGAAYCNTFIKNPSKPQVELFKVISEIFPYPIMNYPYGYYCIDIAIPSLNLAFEYDGSYWHKNKKYDNRRQKYLENHGWKFFRFVDYVPNIKEIKKILEEL